jgi:hypothetical protein
VSIASFARCRQVGCFTSSSGHRISRTDLSIPGTRRQVVESERQAQKQPLYAAASSPCVGWRPRRDSNPCYRREGDAQPYRPNHSSWAFQAAAASFIPSHPSPSSVLSAGIVILHAIDLGADRVSAHALSPKGRSGVGYSSLPPLSSPSPFAPVSHEMITGIRLRIGATNSLGSPVMVLDDLVHSALSPAARYGAGRGSARQTR